MYKNKVLIQLLIFLTSISSKFSYDHVSNIHMIMSISPKITYKSFKVNITNLRPKFWLPVVTVNQPNLESFRPLVKLFLVHLKFKFGIGDFTHVESNFPWSLNSNPLLKSRISLNCSLKRCMRLVRQSS